MWLEAPALEDFLPECEQGRILFTTRNRKLGMKLAPLNIVPIPDVDQDTAVKILEKTLANKDLLSDTTATTTLLEQLAFLPLAITQASAYIIENSIDLSTYLTLLQEQEQDAVELLSEDFRDPGRYKDIQNPVMTTWLVSFKQIQDQNQLAADYLSFMACINPRNIPQSLLPQLGSRKQKIDALGVLNAYSFTNGQDTGIGMHRLVHIATRNWLRKNALFSDSIQRAADQMQDMFPDNHHTNRRFWREYLPHCLVLIRESEFITYQDQYLDLIERIADCLGSDGRYHEAEALYSELMKINQEKNGPEHRDTLRAMHNLAIMYRFRERWDEAERLFMQVLKTSKAKLGADDTDTLTTMSNLAATYRDQGRLEEAEKLEVQAVDMRKKKLGAEDPDTLKSISNLALTYWNQDRLDEAEKLFIQVLETSKTVLEAEHPEILTYISNLAVTYYEQGRWNEAERLLIQMMETTKTVLGAEHPETIHTMSNLACTWKDQGKVQDALALMEECCELHRKVSGPTHSDTIVCTSTLSEWMDELCEQTPTQMERNYLSAL